MQYQYLHNIIKAWESNPYFNPRENKGCTTEEITEWKRLIAPYMKRMPKAIEEDLLYFGKYRFNQLGTYLIVKKIEEDDDELDLKEELNLGFWVCASSYLGILCDNSEQLSQYLQEHESITIEDYDNPPIYYKEETDLEDEFEISQGYESYTTLLNYTINSILPQHKKYFANNPYSYSLKQSLVEFYAEIESVAGTKMIEALRDKYLYISHRIRLEVGQMPLGFSMNEILYQVHKANRQYGEPETLVELAQYSDKIKHLYNQVIKYWEAMK